MFKLLRFYSVTSFFIIFVTAALLTLFYRQVTIHWIEHMAETDNLTLAQTVLNSFKSELVPYLSVIDDPNDRGISWQSPPDELVADILKMTQDTSVESIKIYNQDGQMFLSTQMDQIGTSEGNTPGFRSAINGSIFSVMTYRDIFNRFKGTGEKDNLMHTYIPIRNGPADPVLGVLEIHNNMDHVVEENNKMLLMVLAGSEGLLAILYALLFFTVRYAKNIIDAQQKTIRERTTSLESLSRLLLKNEESGKHKIAHDLHEGIAQTLSAIKMNVESSQLNANNANAKPLESIVPVLQSAIQEVRTIATELRPSSLSDLGLLPTINWFCREFEQQHTGISIRPEISLGESEIPVPLRIVIYRIIESTFKNIAQYSNTDQIKFVLNLADDMIHLIIGDAPVVERPSVGVLARFDPSADPQFRFAEMKERTTLSGGKFSATRNKSGWVTLHASWAC